MRRIKADRFEDVIRRLYEAALDPSLWRDVLHEVADALGADGAALFAAPLSPSRGFYFSPAADAAFSWLAREGVHVHNPRPERALRAETARLVSTEADLFNEWELRHLPFNAALIKLGLRFEAGGVFARIDGEPLLFTTHRSERHEGFDKAEIEAIALLFPHLERAAHIASRLSIAEGMGMLDAFERTAAAAVLLDGRGCVLQMNPSAECLIGQDVDVRGGRICSLDAHSDRALQQVIGSITAGQPSISRNTTPVMASLRRRSGRPFSVYGIPLVGQANDFFQRATAVLVIVDPDAGTSAPAAVLAQSYNLTPAEIRLSAALAEGLDLREAAAAHGVAISTARNQLKAIMAKTGTSRQAELVGLLTRLARLPGNSK